MAEIRKDEAGKVTVVEIPAGIAVAEEVAAEQAMAEAERAGMAA
jgi:hypothetical protein